MRINSFLKGALAGGIGATAVLGATAAFAGSGIGGVLCSSPSPCRSEPPGRRPRSAAHRGTPDKRRQR